MWQAAEINAKIEEFRGQNEIRNDGDGDGDLVDYDGYPK